MVIFTGSYYEDEAACRKWISSVKRSFGKNREKFLEELCRFKTKAADEYWHDRIQDESFLPYIMMCRSEEFSDYCSSRLDDFIERIISGKGDYHDMVNEAYFLLHTCMNKESDKMVEVYRKIGRNYENIRKLKINWADRSIISPVKQPDFLYQRFAAEVNEECENGFFSYLTDILILTMTNAIICDGENETFTAKVKELYEDYPEVYASAGFFAYFINDNSEAYDRFRGLMEDPLDYYKFMWVLDGLECKDGTYLQGSPTTFAGPDNRRVHMNLNIDGIDFRWYEFFTEKILRDAENADAESPYYIQSFCRKFSSHVYNMLSDNDEKIMEACGKYFRRAAVIAGNPADFAGLRRCGMADTPEELESIAMEMAERICQGRQSYRFFVMFRFFKDLDRKARADIISKAADYLLENDHSDNLALQRSAFLYHAELMSCGQSCAFDE